MSIELRHQLVSKILSLTVACPHDLCNPTYCPFHDVRKLTPEERNKWALALSDADMRQLATRHQACLECRALEE